MCETAASGVSSYWPALVGFVAAIFLFVAQEWLRDRFTNRRLRRNLRFELEYNIDTLIQIQNRICGEAAKYKGDDTAELIPNKDMLASHHAKQYYERGLISDKLTPEDMANWNLAILAIHATDETKTYDESIDQITAVVAALREIYKKIFQRDYFPAKAGNLKN
jgi:hypothetical protein